MLNLHLRLTLPALVILLSGMSQIATADEQLQTLISNVCDFQIDMPANPNHEASDPNSKLAKHTFNSTKPRVSMYQVSYNPDEVTDNTPDTAEKWEEYGRQITKDVETGMGATTSSSRVIQYQGMTGYETSFDLKAVPGFSGQLRFFNVIGKDRKSRLYMIMALGPAQFMKSANVTRFFASFKILPAE